MNTITTSKRQIIKEYTSLLNWVLEHSGAKATDEYYKEREVFVARLTAFIRTKGNMSALNTTELLSLCSIVSTYRPMEPFAFLILCAKEVE